MEGILVTDVKHQAFYDIIVRNLEQLFYNEGTNANVDWGIELRLCPCGIQHTETFFVNCREDVIGKYFRPGIIKSL